MYQQTKVLVNSLDDVTEIDIDEMSEFIEMISKEWVSFEQRLVREVGAIDEVRDALKRKKIPFTLNTLKNWFNGGAPKHGKSAREMFYKIAFAKDFSVEKTKMLFTKVYHDRAFDIKIVDEFVYYYALKNNYEYQRARDIVGEINQRLEKRDADGEAEATAAQKAIYTRQLVNAVDNLETDEAVISYVVCNYQMFNTSNVSANETLQLLIDDIKVKPEEVEDIKKENYLKDTASIMARDLRTMDSELIENKNITSISSMLTIITGSDMVKLNMKQGAVYKNAILPKEVVRNFPKKQIMSKANKSYDELRKIIILLAAYKYWVNKKFACPENRGQYNFDSFQDEINGYLFQANLPELYVCNGYDYIFLLCEFYDEKYKGTLNEMPALDFFREMINENFEGSNGF